MSHSEENLVISCNGKEYAAILTHPQPTASLTAEVAFILTHGAGGDMNYKQLVEMAGILAENGISCLRFTCKGLNLVHRSRVYETVLNRLKEMGTFKGCFLAGRSMGARAAATVAGTLAADDDYVLGVVCISYPLHPPNKLADLRSQLLINLRKPVLLLSGTCDAMCSRNLMEETLAKVTAKHTMHWVQGAGHGLEIGSSEARNDMYHTLVTWCSEVCKQSLEYSSVECSRNLERQMAGRNTLTRLRKAAGGTSARRTHEDRKKTEMETHASNSPVLKTRRKRRRVADIE